MILFCGIASEAPLALAIAAAGRLGLEHAVIHQRELAGVEMTVELGENGALDGCLRLGGRAWTLAEITGVYTRLTDPNTIPPRAGESPREREEALRLLALLNDWMEVADCRVVNRVADMASNVSKPFQAQLIAPLFRTPPTLVTNHPEEALRFIRRHRGVIYKSVSSVRSIVRQWTPSDEARLGQLRGLPTQFQALIPGDDVRVHVVGQEVFATEIRTGAVDYRYAQRDGFEAEMQPFDLPAVIADRCRELSARLRLPFCGIDLKRGPAGDYHCFEVNPSPAYSFYEQNTGQAISEALVRYLADPQESEP